MKILPVMCLAGTLAGCVGNFRGNRVLKQVLAASAVLVLSACGGKTMIESDMSHLVSASPASPWLTVENPGVAVLTVTGLEQKQKVQVAPDVATAVEARLRTMLQPNYFTDLIVNCRGLQVAVGAKTEAEPPSLDIDMSVGCRIVARGLVSTRSYRLHRSQAIDPAAAHLDTAVPALIDGASTELADRIWTDVLATGAKR